MGTVSHARSDLGEIATAAIEAAGGGAALAKLCGVTRFAVQQWKARGIPINHVRAVARAANMEPSALRPDAAEQLRPVAA